MRGQQPLIGVAPEPVKYDLRPYQKTGVEIAEHELRTYNRPFVLQAATGAGKSLMIAEICHRMDRPGLILQPSKELLEQNYAKLRSYGVEDVAIYSASKGVKEIDKYTYATIGSIYKKPELFKDVEFILVDECDVVDPKKMGMYRTFFEALGVTAICGLTATPYRIAQRYETIGRELVQTAMLRSIDRIGTGKTSKTFWGKIAYKIETQELMDAGYLCPIKYREDSQDLHRLVVNSTGADFTEESLEAWADDQVLRVADYATWVNKQPDMKRNLVFMPSVAATETLQSVLAGRGIAAHIVSAKTPAIDRERFVREYKEGKVRHMLNVGVFLAGFDVPELNSIIFARPTMSLRIWYQAIGRGVRLDPADKNKVLRVFDLAGVLQTMGRVETIQLGKEANGRTTVVSERGRLDSQPLSNFKVR